MTIPRATYRIQFHPGFTFDDAAAVAGYLAVLGISHLYASPYLQAAPGSTHGYDVVDPGRINDELGGPEGHERLCRALTDAGLGQILDIVPNHMAITSRENKWWWDVLENGPGSVYATYFDVEWKSPEERLSNKILLPILEDHYGCVLDAGKIRLEHRMGSFTVHYHDHVFPVSPRSLGDLLERTAEKVRSEPLAFIAESLGRLPLPTVTERERVRKGDRNKRVLFLHLKRLMEEDPQITAAVDATLEEINADPDLLDGLLEEQNYRMAYWRTASRDLGYRRFFDINTLVGLRAEEENVFRDTHRLVLTWLREGALDGVRIDHPDGLRDPENYLKRLRDAARDAWIVVEKILHPGERLPVTWPVQGTTGYDFLNLVAGLFIDPSGEKPLTDFYVEFTGEEADYRHLAREKKHLVIHELLASDVNRLTELMIQICERHRSYRDYTRYDVNEAIREVMACFPVYRSYVRADAGVFSEEDRAVIQKAIDASKSLRPELDPELFDFMKGLMLLEHTGALETEFVMRFQQMTGPITAKGIEDTAFYCFNRFIALNEVGGDPGQFGVSVESFHRTMAQAAGLRPHAMLSTSTHDTKRSEDVRARLSLLSEIPEEWARAVKRWAAHNEQYRKNGIPDRNTEYLLYQTLVGAWPIDWERLGPFLEKSVREAKVHTSWTRPNGGYEEAVKDFGARILQDGDFRRDLETFTRPLIHPGRINSLSQLLVKLTAPGVPDIYQGMEIWNLSLVDPDNRRPVDFSLLRGLLAGLDRMTVEEIMTRMDDGLPKLWVLRKGLELRKERTSLFAQGDYQPMDVHGEKKEQAAAFVRGGKVLTLVPRFVLRDSRNWENTMLDFPKGRWRNRLTGDFFERETPLQEILSRFPVALLAKEN
jgi:(1->4)-alpha-D-glucan 1-alpha-D-glucosylmutase